MYIYMVYKLHKPIYGYGSKSKLEYKFETEELIISCIGKSILRVKTFFFEPR